MKKDNIESLSCQIFFIGKIVHIALTSFINWKVVEEQKVAAMVASSKTIANLLNELFEAIHGWKGEAGCLPEEKFDRKKKTGHSTKASGKPTSFMSPRTT